MQYLKPLIKPSVIIALCWWLPTSATTAAECRDSEVFKTFMDKQDYRGALQELNKCINATKTPSTEDTKASDDLIKKLLGQTTPPPAFDEVYRNFQSVLATLTAKDLKFQLANYFEGQPEEDKKIFADLRKADEKLYFYYDASRTPLDPRGFALTNKSLIWKNLAGDPEKVAFNDIQSVKLAYELGLSLTGWKLQIDGKELRLSHVPENTIVPLVSAILYFVNANKDSKDKPVTLEVPDREEAILAGWVTLCSNKFQDQQDAVKNLQTLDQCFVNYSTYTKDVKLLGKSFKLSQPDKDLLNKLTQQILVPGKSLEESYANFKTVLSIHFFTDLQFKFKDGFTAKDQGDLFKDARDASDTLYFYFDTGTVAQGTRGLLLTDKAVVGKNLLGAAISFKNLTGSATRLPFDKITSVALAYERDITSPLNAWKLRFNDKKDNDLVLSKLSEDNIELFANAVVYFINTVTKPQLTLQLTNEAKDALTKTFLERYPQIKSMTDSVLGVFGTKKTEETPAKAAEPPAKPEEKKEP